MSTASMFRSCHAKCVARTFSINLHSTQRASNRARSHQHRQAAYARAIMKAARVCFTHLSFANTEFSSTAFCAPENFSFEARTNSFSSPSFPSPSPPSPPAFLACPSFSSSLEKSTNRPDQCSVRGGTRQFPAGVPQVVSCQQFFDARVENPIATTALTKARSDQQLPAVQNRVQTDHTRDAG